MNASGSQDFHVLILSFLLSRESLNGNYYMWLGRVASIYIWDIHIKICLNDISRGKNVYKLFLYILNYLFSNGSIRLSVEQLKGWGVAYDKFYISVLILMFNIKYYYQHVFIEYCISKYGPTISVPVFGLAFFKKSSY